MPKVCDPGYFSALLIVNLQHEAQKGILQLLYGMLFSQLGGDAVTQLVGKRLDIGKEIEILGSTVPVS